MAWFVASKKRDIPGRRWLSILLRTLHLIGIAGLAGGYLYALPSEQWMPYLWLAFATGTLLLLKELYVDRIWLLQLRGQLIVAKLVILVGAHLLADGFPAWGYLIVIFISGIIAHAPGNIRYYSLWHGRRYTRDDWLKETQG